MQPLDGAYEQINGAREHLDTLRPHILEFAKVIANDVSLQYKKGFVNFKGRQIEVPIGTASAPCNVQAPLKVSRLIADVVNNLRTSLDYLVYELACFDAKCIVEKTQFVIVDSEENFRGQLWHLKGLSGEHRAMFERLQPYNGCDWTKFLRDISNPNKHMHLSVIRNTVEFRLDDSTTDAILAGHKMSVDRYASIQIAFANGPLVIDSLEQLITKVAQTLERFNPEFQR